MSNAAVINATNNSGQTVGAPISIETGGDVVLKAYGTGSGNWFVVMAFAPVVNGVTGAPVTLTIDYNQPGRQTSAVGTSASEWVGWVLDQGGTWQASGIVEGYQPGEALSDDLGTFASFEALPKYGVKLGARASVLGVQYTYGAGGWVAVGGASKRYRPRTARRVFQNGASTASVGANQTIINQFHLTTKMASLEFVLENYGSSEVTYDKIAIKPVSTHKSDGSLGSSVVLTYMGSQSITVPAATSNAGTAYAKPGRIKLDKVNIPRIQRTDGGIGYLYNIRGYSPAGGGGLTVAPTYTGLQTAGGLDFAGGTAAGDLVSAFPGVTINGNTSPILGFPIYTSRNDVATIIIVGDSIVQADAVGWVTRAEKALRSAGKSVNFVNFAQGGTNSNYSNYALREALTLLTPTHLVLPFGSINDLDGDTISLPLSLAMDNIQAVADFGCNVFGFSTLAVPLYPERNPAVVSRNAELQAYGIKYADMYPLTVSDAYPNGNNSMYADGVHPTGSTYALMANTFVEAFAGEVR